MNFPKLFKVSMGVVDQVNLFVFSQGFSFEFYSVR